MPTVLALGLDPNVVTLPDNPDISPELVRAYIDSQLDRIRALGYELVTCFVDLGETAEQKLVVALGGTRFSAEAVQRWV